MDKRDIFVQIEQLEEQMGALYGELGQMKKQIVELLEENKRLSIENAQLRKLLKKDNVVTQDQLQHQHQDQPVAVASPIKDVVGQGHDNLTRIYHEGFHICNVYYGHLRTEGDCLFCMSFLNK